LGPQRQRTPLPIASEIYRLSIRFQSVGSGCEYELWKARMSREIEREEREKGKKKREKSRDIVYRKYCIAGARYLKLHHCWFWASRQHVVFALVLAWG
jgi:hypothetical protein